MTKRYSFGNSLKFLGLSLAQVLVYLFASVMLMLGTLMLIGSTFNKDPAKNKPALGVVFLAVCATIGGLPVWRVNRSKKRLISSSDRIERIRAASRMQKAIAIEQLAQELDLTQAQTLTLIRQGVSDGLLAAPSTVRPSCFSRASIATKSSSSKSNAIPAMRAMPWRSRRAPPRAANTAETHWKKKSGTAAAEFCSPRWSRADSRS